MNFPNFNVRRLLLEAGLPLKFNQRFLFLIRNDRFNPFEIAARLRPTQINKIINAIEEKIFELNQLAELFENAKRKAEFRIKEGIPQKKPGRPPKQIN